ncbi:MAG: hypothetical protein ACTSUB_03325 [Candidatus Thorarchaeota archaeon]
MSIHTAKSAKSARYYLIAAVLMFIQTGIVVVVRIIIPNFSGIEYRSMMNNLGIAQVVFPLIGVLFIVGSFFAKTGFGVTGTTERYVGGGYYRTTVETANGITCGCMTGIAVIGVSIGLVIPLLDWTEGMAGIGVLPGILGGFVAMIAGYTSLSATMKEGITGREQDHSVVRTDSRTCPHCNKTGISPLASSCPSCGHVLENPRTCPYCNKTGISPQATACPSCGQPLE